MGGEAGRRRVDATGWHAPVKKRTASMMGIESPTGSHLPVLTDALLSAPDGALVVEHGAGLYSTPLLARDAGIRVVCIEPHPGWSEWARWIYQGAAEIVGTWKHAASHLDAASIVFIDGPAQERGVLLQACLDRGVPCIIAHDTNPDERHHYGYQPHMFAHVDYAITQHTDMVHHTTLWVRRS